MINPKESAFKDDSQVKNTVKIKSTVADTF